MAYTPSSVWYKPALQLYILPFLKSIKVIPTISFLYVVIEIKLLKLTKLETTKQLLFNCYTVYCLTV